MKLFKEKLFAMIIPILQIIIIIAVSIVANENWYRIVIACTGILFNYLVCYGKRYGFLVGSIYALSYGIMAYFDHIYASAFFMIIIQFPMAIISYINWSKKKESINKLEKLTKHQSFLLSIFVIVSYGVILTVLYLLNSSGAVFDAFFLTASLISCILLAKYYKSAYIFIMISGLAGTLLWLYQLITTSKGSSILVLNSFVLFNAIIGIVKNYKKQTM